MDDTEIETLRFVEIGGLGLFKDAFPQQTRFFDINPRPQRDSDFRGLHDLRRALGTGDADLVICNPLDRSPWHPDSIVRMIFNRRLFRQGFSPLRPYAQQLLRFPIAPPLVRRSPSSTSRASAAMLRCWKGSMPSISTWSSVRFRRRCVMRSPTRTGCGRWPNRRMRM